MSRKGIVKGKYCLYCLILLLGTLFSLVLGLIGMKLGTLKMITVVEMLLICITIAVFAGSISLLLLYTWQGALEKIELITVISYAIAAGAVTALLKLSGILFSVKVYGFIFCIVLSIIFFIITYFISVKSFEKKS